MEEPERSKIPKMRRWALAAAAALGMVVGLGLFTFSFAQGTSYFSSDPAACVNCHIMRDQFDNWNRSSHKAVATCNDCHTPHDNALAKWAVKGLNGLKHSMAFTLENFPEPIRITSLNATVAQQNCVQCHETMVSQVHTSASGEERSCISCHANPGHGR